MPDVNAYLETLRTRVDQHFEAAAKRDAPAMQCQAGCAQCCHQRFGVFEVEAAPIREALHQLAQTNPQLRQRVREQADDPHVAHHCALLVDDVCSVYSQRPLICRSHGLPIVVDDEAGEPQVDHCPLNFRDQPPSRPSLLVLNRINEPLSVLAQLAHPDSERVALEELARG